MGRFTALLFFLVVTVFHLVSANSAHAQGGVGNGQLNGTITDSSGGVISGAAIIVRNPATAPGRRGRQRSVG
jgi:hypothetical protein